MSSSQLGTVEDVRLSLGDVDGTLFDSQVVEQALSAARTLVPAQVSGADESGLEQAIVDTAAYRTYTASPKSVQKSAASNSNQQNVEQYVKELKRKKVASIRAAGDQFIFESYG